MNGKALRKQTMNPLIPELLKICKVKPKANIVRSKDSEDHRFSAMQHRSLKCKTDERMTEVEKDTYEVMSPHTNNLRNIKHFPAWRVQSLQFVFTQLV